jgi:hypothetical protein
MSMIDAIFANGRVVDLIVAVMGVEIVVLYLYRAVSGRGLRLADLAIMMLPGLALLLALRTTLVGGPPHEVALWLVMALFAHLADLWRRQSRS